MTLSTAERQGRYRQRLKARAAINTGGRLYDLLVGHLRACAKADGTVRRYKPPKREPLSPEHLANEICLDVERVVSTFEQLPSFVSPKKLNERQEQTLEQLRHFLENLTARVTAPNDPSDNPRE